MKTYEKLKKIEKEMNSFFVEREESIRGLILAVLSKNNILFLGPPGVAKSLIVSSWQKHISNTKYFEYLLNKYSTPEDILGTISLKGLEEDRFRRVTTDKIPDSNVVFLDEIFKCNIGTLNAMLPILNERIFHNDGQVVKLDLLTVVGASNEIPDSEDGLEALYDRFLLKYVISPIREETNVKKMLLEKMKYSPETFVDVKEIYEAADAVEKVEFNEGMVELLIKLRRSLNIKGVSSTDRTYNMCKNILKAQAFMSGRDSVEEEDFTVLRHVLWSDPKDERTTLSVVFDLVSPETGKIIEMYEQAKEISEKVLAIEDEKKRMEKGLDASGKIKIILSKIANLTEDMRKKGKDTKEAKEYADKLTELFEEVFKKSVGFKIPSNF